MKEKKLFDAITDVKSELIDEARTTKLKRKKHLRQVLTAAVACAALIVGSVTFLPKEEVNFTTMPPLSPLIDVVFPPAYAFDSSEVTQKIYEENPVSNEFLTATNQFAYKTAAQVFAENGGNVNYSPLSLYYATALAATGANGKTAREMLDLLNMPDKNRLSQECGNLYRRLYSSNSVGKLKISNSLWLSSRLKWKNDFVKNAADNFYAHSFSADFSDKSTGKAMAEWVADSTNGSLAPEFNSDPNQIMSIINTVYFYDEWNSFFPAELTAADNFNVSAFKRVKCDFINTPYSLGAFAKGDGFTRADIPLKNAGSMVFILPDKGVSPRKLLATPEKAEAAFEGGENLHGSIIWKIPKFNFNSDLDLKKTLTALGVSAAFDAAKAEFGGMTDRKAYINKIRQQTHIGINEKGVEAAAFTEITAVYGGTPAKVADMILDRPFIYGIKAADGTLLFIGICENPAENN